MAAKWGESGKKSRTKRENRRTSTLQYFCFLFLWSNYLWNEWGEKQGEWGTKEERHEASNIAQQPSSYCCAWLLSIFIATGTVCWGRVLVTNNQKQSQRPSNDTTSYGTKAPATVIHNEESKRRWRTERKSRDGQTYQASWVPGRRKSTPDKMGQ